MLWVHVLFVGLLVGSQAFFTGLAVLNRRHAVRAVDEERDWLREELDVEDADRLLDYHLAGTGFSHLRSWVVLAGILLVVYGGALNRVVDAVEATSLGPVAQGTAFFLLVAGAYTVLTLPFDAVETFVVEELFDFNEQTPALWVRDSLVSLALTLIITGLLGAAVLWFLQALPALWWVAAWGLFVAFSVSMLVIYPRVIAPLFNDFEPVEEGDLHDAVTEVFDRAGFSCSQIYVMDASRRSSHSNAYFVGFGRTKRVVLFDTLVDQMDLDEVQAVLAHELAHWQKAHVWKQLASSALWTGGLLAVLAYLLDAGWLGSAFGLPADAAYAKLLVAAVWVTPLGELAAPVRNRLSLAHEREADAFAADVMADPAPLADALRRLASENLANPFPHPAYAAFHYNHPPIPERLRRLREGDGTEGVDGAATTAD